MTTVDIIAAVRNEEKCISLFVDAVDALSLPADLTLRVLFIEDSSTDATLDVLRQQSANNSGVGFISLEKGFGQCAALVYGMTQSDADAVIMMDIDGGHPVELIPKMLESFTNGTEIVQAVRRNLRDRKAYRDAGAKLFNFSMKLLTGVNLNEQNVYYRLVSRRVKELIIRKRRWHGFLRLNFLGSDVCTTERIQFTATERRMGQSKYGFRRLLAFAIEGLLSLVPVWRGVLILLSVVSIAVLMRGILYGSASAALAIGSVYLLILYVRACNNGSVDRMCVKEAS